MALLRLKEDYGDGYSSNSTESSLSAEEQGEMFFKRELALINGVREEIPIDIDQSTNERVKGNIMSVELALQRELEYRKKIEKLQQQPRSDFEEPTMPVQGQGAPSNLELGEMNKKIHSNDVSCSQVDYGDGYSSNSTESSLSAEEQGEMFFKRELALINGVREEIPIDIDQLTNERVKGNIMSVELALQRELEYRKKIEKLQQRPRSDFEEPTMPVQLFKGQETPSNLELGEMNKKPHSNSVSCSQGRMLDPIFFKRELERGRPQEEITIRAETDKRVGRNIIPMELAIHRELGYQRKMESLQRQPCPEFQGPSIPFQGSSPANLRTVGVKRKAPSGNLRCFVPQQVQQSYRQQSSGIQSINMFCKECQVLCASANNLKQHYVGRKHKTRLEELKNQKNNGNKEVGMVWCDLCTIPCMNELAFQQHLAGKKHGACAQAFNKAMTVGGKGAGGEVSMANRKHN